MRRTVYVPASLLVVALLSIGCANQSAPLPPKAAIGSLQSKSTGMTAKVVIWYDGSVQDAKNLAWQKRSRNALINKLAGTPYEERDITDDKPSAKNGGRSDKALYEQKVPKFKIYIDNLGEGQILSQLKITKRDGEEDWSGPELFSGFIP
jgi:hypothetical protein